MPGVTGAAANVFASIPKGSELAGLAKATHTPLNPLARPANGPLFFDGASMDMPMGEAKISVIGPLKADLEALRKAWVAWQASQTPQAHADLAAYVDKSVPNLSSIVALVTWKTKKVLLTGDARGDKVLEGLEAAQQLPAGGKLSLDVLKVPHHGSVRNLGPDFFARLPARHYVISANGKFGNPDRAALELLHAARGDGAYTLHLTYKVADIEATNKAIMDQAAAKDSKNPPYKPLVNGIADVIKAMRDAGATVIEGPVSIDLKTA